MVLSDKDILARCDNGLMIYPYERASVRNHVIQYDLEELAIPILSRGLSSAGYDISLVEDMKVRRLFPALGPIDPKRKSSPEEWEHLSIQRDETGSYFVLPGLTGALSASSEYITMPNDVIGICFGKSTYARNFVQFIVTPLEPGWQGQITIEIVNHNHDPVKVYTGEGALQVLFVKLSSLPLTSYAARGGKYQGQTGITEGAV